MQTFTRKQYMNKECSHHEYYKQFITPQIKYYVESRFTKEFLIKCYEEDEHMNNLGRVDGRYWLKAFDHAFEVWGKSEIAKTNRRINSKSVASYADLTCVIKAYMREWIK